MQVEIFTLCDAATQDHGKLNLLGTFDTLTYPEYPHEVGGFAIVARVRFSAEDGGDHEMDVRWFDADGEEVDRTEPCRINLELDDRRDLAQHVWVVHGKTVYEPTEYLLQLAVDECPVASIPLILRQPST
jgi:hypothetical protein